MANPQWKSPHNHDNATATIAYGRSSFNSSPNISNKLSNSSNNDSNSSSATISFREAGIVEKLLASYGFIQCCERQARLFFHYSQYTGNIEHLKLGDPVEFEMTYDRRTGKPIASAVVKIASEAFMAEELSSEPVTGFITTEISNDREGRVAYENRGECFFLPFTKDDVEDDNEETLKSKDSVTFYIANDKSGNLRARHIKLEVPTPKKFQGVICTLKDSFGFIERSDVVKEIFFHSSECDDFKDLSLGDDVEFCIQSRNNKEVAVNVRRLSPGTVVFEDVSAERFTGHVIKTIERLGAHSRQQSSNSVSGPLNDPFPGRIRCKKNNSDVEIAFGERDVKGEFTIQIGDRVLFNIVTDRRDQLQHATNIEMHDESFVISGEHREQGYIAAMKDYYGFIKCLNREGTRVYFRMNELLIADNQIKLNDEVEFTVAPDLSSPGRLQAIRIKTLPDGTIFKNLISSNKRSSSPQNNIINGGGFEGGETGLINGKRILSDGFTKIVNDFPLIDLNTELATDTVVKVQSSNPLKNSQEVIAKSNSWSEILSQLDIGTDKTDLLSISNEIEHTLTNHEPLQPLILDLSNKPKSVNEPPSVHSNKKDDANSNDVRSSHTKNGVKYSERGYIVALKDTFGFIEADDSQRELFFHYSIYDGDVDVLTLGDYVEYCASLKNSKFTAISVRRINSRVSNNKEEIQSEVLTGVVTRTVRTFNPDQNEYPGYVRVVNQSNGTNDEIKEDNEIDQKHYEFSMISLSDMHEFIQKGDVVKFQIAINKGNKKERAVNIKPIRTKFQGTVDCVKGSFGFLIYDSREEGKTNIFFHMSEVKGNNNLQSGDFVEFVVVQSQRSGKYSACNVVKLGESQIARPERLTRVKVDDCGPRVVVIRTPKGPDGTKGFTNNR